jgi:hypothetical protein
LLVNRNCFWPSHIFFCFVLASCYAEDRPRTSYMLSTCSTTGLYPQPLFPSLLDLSLFYKRQLLLDQEWRNKSFHTRLT